jgi:phage shock protein PspC (stress-responsive transcriptional regulator)
VLCACTGALAHWGNDVATVRLLPVLSACTGPWHTRVRAWATVILLEVLSACSGALANGGENVCNGLGHCRCWLSALGPSQTGGNDVDNC